MPRAGIEPATRGFSVLCLPTELSGQKVKILNLNLVEGEGFEPSKRVATDLQSAPFGHSGIPPKSLFNSLLSYQSIIIMSILL